MKKILIAAFSLATSLQASAYSINMTQQGLQAGDTFDVVFESQAGGCKVTDTSYECSKMRSESNGIDASHFKDYFDLMTGDSKHKLLEFTIRVNGKSFPSCTHLEKKPGNSPMRVTAIVTPEGCK